MSDRKTNYRLAEAEAKQRLDDWACDTAEAADLSRELALCRTLLESAVRENNSPLARDLLKTLSQLADRHRIAEVKYGALLHKTIVLQIARQIGNIIGEELSHLDGWELIADKIQQRVGEAIAAARNDEKLLGKI